MTPPATAPAANNLEAFFMPFTANRQFKKNPRLLARAKGVHYWTPEGRKVIDGTAGLWCVNAGHGREEIKQAIARQLDEMDYAPSFQMGHPKSFELAARHVAMLPGDLDHAFYCNSGSEAVDSALKIALAWQRARGQGTRTRLIGRERGYHGVGFGGISVGGMVNNRKQWGVLLPGVDHMPHTHLPAKNAFFGRLGTGFAADFFNVIPDLMTVAKGISNATVPMGGVFVRKHIYDGLMNGPENVVELFHGYTYSAHPLACAAASAVLDIYKDEGLFQRSAELSKYWEDGVHSLKGLPGVTDIRNLGLAAGIDMEGRKDAIGARGFDTFVKAFELGLMVRQAADTIAMSPPLVIERNQIDEIIDLTGKAIKATA